MFKAGTTILYVAELIIRFVHGGKIIMDSLEMGLRHSVWNQYGSEVVLGSLFLVEEIFPLGFGLMISFWHGGKMIMGSWATELQFNVLLRLS